MTCIIGYEHKGKVYIGGDSAGVSRYDMRIIVNSKVFRNGPIICGFTSSFRMGQILQYSFSVPKQGRESDHKYLCTKFIDKLIKCFTNKKFAKEENNEVTGGTFMLGYKGKLYRVESDFNITRIDLGYEACGCGEDYAMGAMGVLHEIKDLTPEQKITKALEIAESLSAGVHRPFNIISI